MLRGLYFLTTVLLLLLLVPEASSQDIRKKIRGAVRKAKNETNRTKRDVKRIKKTLSSEKRTIDPAADTLDVVKWEKTPYIPNSGMIHDYEHVFSFLHVQQELTFQLDSTYESILWDSLNNVFYKNKGKGQAIRKDMEVMGWHPHWMEDAYKFYNYGLLSIISYYSYDIDPFTGDYWQTDIIDQLMQSSLPDSAYKHGVRAFISVTSLTAENNKQFLSDPDAQYYFRERIIQKLNEKKDGDKNMFSGIDLNFEQIAPEDRDRFTDFVITTCARLKTEGYSVILDVPYYDENKVYDFEKLQGHVEYFNIMGYGFSGVHSNYPGSISPLRHLDNKPGLIMAVNDLFVNNVSPQNIILTLPLYGVTWDITNIEQGKVSYADKSIPYYDILAEYSARNQPFYDALSGSFFYVTDQDSIRKMCWYENEISLDLKFKWLKEEMGLRGAGLWALGYTKGDSGIWKAVYDNFAQDTLVVARPMKVSYSGPYGVVRDIVKYKKVIGFGFLVFAGFLILGLVISLFDWKVREILFQKQSFRIIYCVLFVVLVTISMKWCLLETYPWSWVLLPAYTAVGILLINYGFTEYRRKLR